MTKTEWWLDRIRRRICRSWSEASGDEVGCDTEKERSMTRRLPMTLAIAVIALAPWIGGDAAEARGFGGGGFGGGGFHGGGFGGGGFHGGGFYGGGFGGGGFGGGFGRGLYGGYRGYRGGFGGFYPGYNAYGYYPYCYYCY
jgi:hypothetical protein